MVVGRELVVVVVAVKEIFLLQAVEGLTGYGFVDPYLIYLVLPAVSCNKG